MSLPTKDGTWDELCEQATQSIDRLIEIALSKMGLGPVAGIFSAPSTCCSRRCKACCAARRGGSSSVMVDTSEKDYTCGECQGADVVDLGRARRCIRNPDGTFKGFVPGQTCKIDGMSSFLCANPNYAGFVTCADGKEMKSVALVECLMKVKKPADVWAATIDDKPGRSILPTTGSRA